MYCLSWGLHQGVFTTALLPRTKQQLIAVDDIGALAALMFEHDMQPGARILEIAGDELTPIEMAAALSDALGRRIPYLQIPGDLLIKLNENSGKGCARINAGEMTRVDIASIRELHPGLMTFRSWLCNGGAKRLAALLSRESAGYLSGLPAWRLEGLSD